MLLSCQQVTEIVTDYLEARIPRGRRAIVWLHLATCGPCRRYLRQMRRTVRTLGHLPAEPIPPAVMDELRRRFRSLPR
jgi:hypothetical protein